MKVFLIILAVLLIVISAVIVFLSYYFSQMVVHPSVNSLEKQIDEAVGNGRFTHEYLNSLRTERFTIQSEYGYSLHGIIQNNSISILPENHKKVAILCHGYTSGKITMSGYARRLLDMGFTCIMYDHRNHGESKGCAPTTMGYYEKYDLKAIADFCYDRYGNDIGLVTYGESMGSATVLSHLAIDDRPVLTIADCGYSNLRELFIYMLHNTFHIPIHRSILWIADKFLKNYGQFTMDQVDPKQGAIVAKSPILFIHGLNDTFIPYTMSSEMSKLGTGVRELFLCPNAEHALSEVTMPDEYTKVLSEFINKNYPSDNDN